MPRPTRNNSNFYPVNMKVILTTSQLFYLTLAIGASEGTDRQLQQEDRQAERKIKRVV